MLCETLLWTELLFSHRHILEASPPQLSDCGGFRRLGFPGNSDGKESTCNAGDLGSTPGLVISPGEGNGNPLQYSCLENSMDRGAWKAAVHGVEKSQYKSE